MKGKLIQSAVAALLLLPFMSVDAQRMLLDSNLKQVLCILIDTLMGDTKVYHEVDTCIGRMAL